VAASHVAPHSSADTIETVLDPVSQPDSVPVADDADETILAELVAQGRVRLGRGTWRDHVATEGEPTSIASERLAELRGDAADRLRR
jgi:hypothetical protein